MAGMSFGYRESPDFSLWDYLVMAQYEKNKQFGKNVVNPLLTLFKLLFNIIIVSRKDYAVVKG
jgi:hypothetical protein